VTPSAVRRWGGFLLALTVAWRLVRWGLGFPLWGDEAFVLVNLQERGYADLFRPLEYGQIAPFLWVWMEETLHRIGGDSLRLLRLPALLAGVASAFLFHRLAFRLAPGLGGLLGFAVFAASYYPVRHAAEIKPYSTDLLVALVLLSLAVSLLLPVGDRPLAPRRRRNRLVAFWAVAFFGLGFSYPSPFVVAPIALALLVQARREGPPRRFLVQFVVLALWAGAGLALAWFHAIPHARAASWLREMAMWQPTFPPVSRPWLLPEWFVRIHSGYMAAYPTGGRDFGSLATFLLALLGVATWRPAHRGRVLWLLLGPLPFLFAAAALRLYPYGGSVRVSIFLAPATCLLTGLGLLALLRGAARPCRPERRGRCVGALAHGFLALFAAFPVGGIVEDLRRPYKLESDLLSQRFTADLAARVRPGERLVVWTTPGAPDAPDWLALGGSLARLRAQLHAVGLAPEWNAPPPQRDGLETVTWLVRYRDDDPTHAPFPEARFAADLERWREASGGDRDGEVLRLPLQGTEEIVLYRFGPRAPRR